MDAKSLNTSNAFISSIFLRLGFGRRAPGSLRRQADRRQSQCTTSCNIPGEACHRWSMVVRLIGARELEKLILLVLEIVVITYVFGL